MDASVDTNICSHWPLTLLIPGIPALRAVADVRLEVQDESSANQPETDPGLERCGHRGRGEKAQGHQRTPTRKKSAWLGHVVAAQQDTALEDVVNAVNTDKQRGVDHHRNGGEL